MKKKKKKKGFKIFLICVFIVFGGLLIRQQSIINRLNAEQESYVEQKEKLKVQNNQLKEKKKEANSETYGETLARENLGMIKEGEILFRDKNKIK